ncbi:MAG: lipopolysaccharide biosynthesis protein, partial [Gammaproteobacteria bacterium]|nr:lipopolysaccharide biosynthesis protein [Gammaproteobacteria bacterium]
LTLNVEAELQRLDRDYEVNRANYEALLKRRESLNISDDVNQTTDTVQFNVIEPPRVPLTPVSPNRALFNSGILVAGFGAGVALAWLVAMLNPGIYSRRTITEVLDVPVLGTVSRVWTPHEKFRRKFEVAGFALGCVALLGSFLALQAVHRLGIDVFEKLTSLAGQVL